LHLLFSHNPTDLLHVIEKFDRLIVQLDTDQIRSMSTDFVAQIDAPATLGSFISLFFTHNITYSLSHPHHRPARDQTQARHPNPRQAHAHTRTRAGTQRTVNSANRRRQRTHRKTSAIALANNSRTACNPQTRHQPRATALESLRFIGTS
jgi:hypothetical protein